MFQVPLEGDLFVGLRGISYVVGYYNVSEERGNDTVHYDMVDGSYMSTVPDGLYNVDMYEKELQKTAGVGLSIEAVPVNGRASVTIDPATNLVGFQDKHGLLGVTPVVRVGDTVVGTGTIGLLSPKQLFVHCPQINRACNLHNGKPSDILDVLPVSAAKYGLMVSHRFQDPCFKKVSGGMLHRLDLVIRDEEGRKVNFHGEYIRYTLVIRNEHLRA